MSGEQLDQTAPTLAVARNAAMVSGILGMYETTRSPGFTPSPRRPAAIAATLRSSAAHEISCAGRASDRARIAGNRADALRRACSA
jgi:hypothetical protein